MHSQSRVSGMLTGGRFRSFNAPHQQGYVLLHEQDEHTHPILGPNREPPAQTMSKSRCQRATPKLNLQGLRREVERGAAISAKVESTVNSVSASESNSGDDGSDAYSSDGLDSHAGESVGSSKVTLEPVRQTPGNEEGFNLLESRMCSSTSLKKDRSVGGLVASNDFFTPRPNLRQPPTLTEVPQSLFSSDRGAGTLASVQKMAIKRNGNVDPHPDSLRGRYAVKSTPRQQSAVDPLKSSFGTPRMGTPRLMTPRDASNCSVGFVIKERVNNFTRSIQQSYNSERRVCRTGKSVSDLEVHLLEHGITPMYQPEIGTTQSPPRAITDITDVRSFLCRPAPEGCAPIQCYVQRHFQAGRIFPRFRLYLQEGNQFHFLLSARKRKKSMTSNYILSLDEDDISRRTGNYFGKLRSNLFGTEFWFYNKGARPKLGQTEASLNRRVELGAITCPLLAPRHMTAIIPALDAEGKPYIIEAGPSGAHSLLTKFKNRQDLDKMIVLHNRKPVWIETRKSYGLDFKGRVTRASVKNLQFVGAGGETVLQFGKVEKSAYHIDYQYPISALQAFLALLSAH